ncbi:MAG: DEAD/DEAH box helicase [Phycisphaerales bacterium]|nr:DEAD/DEAH box helicase [Phycisphaerales bacterium]
MKSDKPALSRPIPNPTPPAKSLTPVSDGFDDLDLHPLVRRGITRLGYTAPTEIQRALIPVAKTGKDAIGLAPTGTGKTLAYGITLADVLLRDKPVDTARKRPDPNQRLRAIVVVPTRELAQQVGKEIQELVKGSLLRVVSVFGKVALAPQREAVKSGVDIVVGTPGRIRELLDIGALTLAYLKCIVVDEADRMLDMGFLPQVEWMLERTPPGRQKLLLSATLPREVEALAARMLNDHQRIETGKRNTAATHLTHSRYLVSEELKTGLLLQLAVEQGMSAFVVYCRTRRRVGWVVGALRRHGVETAEFHGERSTLQRQKALESFATGKSRVLIATDVAARGLHIPRLKTVINYDVPTEPQEWLHRVGRAGHGSQLSNPSSESDAASITFIAAHDIEAWDRIIALAHPEVTARKLPALEKFARKVDLEKSERHKASAAREAKATLDEQKAAKPPRSVSRFESKKWRGTKASSKITKGEKTGTGVKKIGRSAS